MEKFIKTHRTKLLLAGLSLPVIYLLGRHFYRRKNKKAVKTEREVLPTNVEPKVYDVELTPDLKTFTCPGKVVITLNVKKQTTTIVLNSKEIEFKASDVEVISGSRSWTPTKVTFDEKTERVTLLFDSNIPVGEATLSIDFTSLITDDLHGFYRSTYTKNGEERYMGTTQFEPTHCREAFPCWDEPLIKAVFRLTFNVPVDRTILSCMPIVSDTANTDTSLRRVVFDKTPIMSTYLLAWVIGEFDYTEDKTNDGVIVRAYTQQGKKDQGVFALYCAKKTLEFFTEYFGIKFPLPKLDMIAIPDFAAGAMENWGLVTYRETALLWSKGSSASAKERVAYVVAHELAHQWFGNLVSPSWWRYLWLNEGFATWAGNMAVDHLFPKWDTWTKFVSGTVTNACKADALESSHPVEVEVLNALQVMEIFDAISYYKGSSVIRMLANYLGEENFREGLRTYLDEKKFACATTEDLWSHCTKASGQDVPTMMDNWIKETGYPFVTASCSSSSSSSLTLTLTQKRFLANGAKTADNVIWFCPVGVIIGVGDQTLKRQRFNFNKKKQSFQIDLPTGTTSNDKWWIKINEKTASFFRVMYDSSLSERLTSTVISKLHPIDRISIQTDVFALIEAGYESTANAIRLAASFRNEDNYSVWADLDTSLLNLLSMYTLEDKPYADLMRSFICWLHEPIMERVGWESKEGEEQSRTLLRPLVIKTIGSCGSQKVIDEANKRFKNHVNGEEEIPKDLRLAVFSIVLKYGGQKEYDELIKLYGQVQMQVEKVEILRVLGANAQRKLLHDTIDFGFSDNVRDQDTIYCFASVARNSKGTELAWQWFQKNWELIAKTFAGGGFMLPNFIKITCSSFASMRSLSEVQEFFKDRETPGADRTVKQVLEKIETRAKWIERDNDAVEECLKSKFWESL